MDEYELQEKQITEAMNKYKKSKDISIQIEISSFIERLIMSWICMKSFLMKILQIEKSINGIYNKKNY